VSLMAPSCATKRRAPELARRVAAASETGQRRGAPAERPVAVAITS
jgi:hypothetical protein